MDIPSTFEQHIQEKTEEDRDEDLVLKWLQNSSLECPESPEHQIRVVSLLYEIGLASLRKLLKHAKAALTVEAGEREHPKKIHTLQHDADASSDHPRFFEQQDFEDLQTACVRLSVWGEDFNVSDGQLDKQLNDNPQLREDVVIVLMHLYDAVLEGLLRLSTESEVREETRSTQVVQVIEIVKSYIEGDAYSGVEVSSLFDIIEEISVAISGLGDLSFCLETPLMMSLSDGVLESPNITFGEVLFEPYQAYEEGLRHRFPEAHHAAIMQHAKANLNRFLKIQAWRQEASELTLDLSLEEEIQMDEKEPNNLETHTISKTLFHDSGIGTSHRHESSYAKSMMSFTNKTREQFKELLPDLPAQGTRSGIYQCSICLRDIYPLSQAFWHMHVLEDLAPYVCIFPECTRAADPFEHKESWLHHIQTVHRAQTEDDVDCDLCRKTLCGDIASRIDHLEEHYIAIALAVMPNEDNLDEEEDNVSERLPDELVGTPRAPVSANPRPRVMSYRDALVRTNQEKKAAESPILPAMRSPSVLSFTSMTSMVNHAGGSSSSQEARTPPCLACPYANCEAKFTGGHRRGSMARHLRLTHGQYKEEYHCEFCTRRPFRRADARLKHYKTAHPEMRKFAVEAPRKSE